MINYKKEPATDYLDMVGINGGGIYIFIRVCVCVCICIYITRWIPNLKSAQFSGPRMTVNWCVMNKYIYSQAHPSIPAGYICRSAQCCVRWC
jgi:hypothetical protein